MQLTHLAPAVAVTDTNHLVATANRRKHLGAAKQPKRRFLFGGSGKQLEEIPLWDERNVLVRTGNSAQVDFDRCALDIHVHRIDLAVRHPGEIRGQTEFVE